MTPGDSPARGTERARALVPLPMSVTGVRFAIVDGSAPLEPGSGGGAVRVDCPSSVAPLVVIAVADKVQTCGTASVVKGLVAAVNGSGTVGGRDVEVVGHAGG